MAVYFPIVFEREPSGSVSGAVAGLPIYAQGATQRQAERAICAILAAYVTAHPQAAPAVTVKVARVGTGTQPAVAIVSAAALLGGRTSRRKAASSRRNGRLGGRPRKGLRPEGRR